MPEQKEGGDGNAVVDGEGDESVSRRGAVPANVGNGKARGEPGWVGGISGKIDVGHDQLGTGMDEVWRR